MAKILKSLFLVEHSMHILTVAIFFPFYYFLQEPLLSLPEPFQIKQGIHFFLELNVKDTNQN